MIGNENQMKARLFEVCASNSLLVTERCPNIESYLEEDKEAIFFSSPVELCKKIRFLLENEVYLNNFSKSGYNRFLKDHTSKIRLSEVINNIENLRA